VRISSGKYVWETLPAALFFLPEDRKLRIIRWFRAHFEYAI